MHLNQVYLIPHSTFHYIFFFFNWVLVQVLRSESHSPQYNAVRVSTVTQGLRSHWAYNGCVIFTRDLEDMIYLI